MRAGSLAAAVFACLALAAPAGAADPLRHHQWGLTMIGADAARATATGAGATVAVIDSGGAFGHPDLQGRLVAGPDYVDGDGNPADANGHGTHVAGIVAANSGNGVGVESVAPGARVLVIRVLNADGDQESQGDGDSVAAAVRWATDQGAHVVNLSLGPSVPLTGSEEFDAALDYALDRGVVVVAAAGNGVAGTTGLPFCDQPSAGGRLLCVGAVDRHGNRSHFSNYGDGLAISAPGGAGIFAARGADDILSTVPSPPSGSSAGPYDYMAGTSQATPHVSGVAALLASLGVRGEAARRRILATARDAGPPGPDDTYGAGIVDARAAVAGLGPAGGGAGAGGSGGSESGAGSGAGAPSSAPSSGSAVRVYLARVHRLRTVLRRGLRATCLASGAGLCRVNVYAGRRRIATGSRRVVLGRRATVVVRLTRRGRTLLRSALRRRRAMSARAYVSLPGARTVRRTLRLRP